MSASVCLLVCGWIDESSLTLISTSPNASEALPDATNYEQYTSTVEHWHSWLLQQHSNTVWPSVDNIQLHPPPISTTTHTRQTIKVDGTTFTAALCIIRCIFCLTIVQHFTSEYENDQIDHKEMFCSSPHTSRETLSKDNVNFSVSDNFPSFITMWIRPLMSSILSECGIVVPDIWLLSNVRLISYFWQPEQVWASILSLPGKSYTMIGRDDSLQGLGIIPCAISWLFKLINERKEKTGARFSVRVSAVEVCLKLSEDKKLPTPWRTMPCVWK